MKSITIIPAILIVILSLLVTCKNENDNCHRFILIVNDSKNAIYFHPSASYPDTLTLYPNPTLSPESFKIENQSSKKDISRDCIEGIIKTTQHETIMYFIYDANLLETTSWDTIVKYYMILKRYDLTIEDLQRSDWTITYP